MKAEFERVDSAFRCACVISLPGLMTIDLSRCVARSSFYRMMPPQPTQEHCWTWEPVALHGQILGQRLVPALVQLQEHHLAG